MAAIELKKNFHHLIDSIENEKFLKSFYDIMKSKAKTIDGQLWTKLSHSEQNELLLSFEESEEDYNLINQEEIKRKHEKWH